MYFFNNSGISTVYPLTTWKLLRDQIELAPGQLVPNFSPYFWTIDHDDLACFAVHEEILVVDNTLANYQKVMQSAGSLSAKMAALAMVNVGCRLHQWHYWTQDGLEQQKCKHYGMIWVASNNIRTISWLCNNLQNLFHNFIEPSLCHTFQTCSVVHTCFNYQCDEHDAMKSQHL